MRALIAIAACVMLCGVATAEDGPKYYGIVSWTCQVPQRNVETIKSILPEGNRTIGDTPVTVVFLSYKPERDSGMVVCGFSIKTTAPVTAQTIYAIVDFALGLRTELAIESHSVSAVLRDKPSNQR